MRIDRFLTGAGLCSRSEASKRAARGEILVNGKVCKNCSEHIEPERDIVEFCGETVNYLKHIYIMLNKPEKYVSATDDSGAPTVIELLPPNLRKTGLFPCGRLDKYTVGFVLLTNDGAAAHNMLSPKHHVEKVYAFELERALDNADKQQLESGVDIGGYTTKPCTIIMDSPVCGRIILTEGKYHQIKRMAQAVDNKIIYLERISFAGISLDSNLKRGEWRYLNESEIKMIEKYFVE